MRSPPSRAALLGLALLGLACDSQKNVEERPVLLPPGGVNRTPSWDDNDITPSSRLGSASSTKAVFYGLWLPSGVVAACSWGMARMLRRRGRREVTKVSRGAVREGLTAIQGTVDSPEGPAVVVEILQKRSTSQDKSGKVYIYWNEQSRRVKARPFRLNLPDGGVVQVEPNERVLLRDEVDSPEMIDSDSRRRCVRLTHGEKVWVTGRLSGQAGEGGSAYRESESTAVLRPNRFSHMVISTEPPGKYLKGRAQFHRRWLTGALITLAVTHAVVLGNFTLQTFSGRKVTLTIEKTRTWDVWHKPKNQKGYWEHHYAVIAREKPESPPEEHEVSSKFYTCVRGGDCRTVPTTRAWLTGDALRSVGRGATVFGVQVAFASLVGWATLLIYWITARSTRPWYAGGKVNE